MQTGSKRKFQHCGNSAAANVWKTQFGIGFHCYRCKESDFEKFGVRSVAEVLEARAAFDTLSARTTRIPSNAVRLDEPSVPAEARVWVLRAGLSPEEATERYGFAYHSDTRRVFIPIGDKTVLARAVFREDVPKYKLFGLMDGLLYHLTGTQTPLVLVEDVLSAIKVNKAGYSSCAILGTSISPETLATLSAIAPDIVIWLDPDKAGLFGRSYIKKALGLYPVNVRYARTESTVDPKYLSTAEISTTIEATMKHGG